jgi:hypothetical protein
MLKHCHSSSSVDPSRRSTSRRSLTSTSIASNSISDSASLNSTGSVSFNSSFGSSVDAVENVIGSRRSSFSSPEPASLVSRASSFASLSLTDSGPKTPIKVFAKCLRADIEYKTLSIGSQTDCKELIWLLLAKYKMKHRDPNLFYLTMDITIKRTGIPLKRTLVLDDDSRPAELKSCHPWGECKFTLQMRKGAGLVRVHDSVLMAESKYKALLISEHTTVEEVMRMLFHCYGLDRIERVENYCIYEQCQSQCYERRLNNKDRPAQVQSLWPSQNQFMFVLKRSIGGLTKVATTGLDSAGVSPVNSERDPTEVSEEILDSPGSPTTSVSSSSDSSTCSTVASFQMSSPTKYFKQQPHLRPLFSSSPGPRSLPSFELKPKFNLNMASIHESGLPPPPALKPKPTHSLLTTSSLLHLSSPSSASNRTSLGSLSSGSRSSSASFHDYENYFYI